GVRETTDVVQAVGGKVAVIDEEDVHAVVRVERKRKGRPATLRGSASKVNADFSGYFLRKRRLEKRRSV
ncbi:MAG: hypothetical protein NTX09_19110, partial [Verrucomicrobia bacterium]|nr:hypothetical protein [Verrucomicrobiota bacterium]